MNSVSVSVVGMNRGASGDRWDETTASEGFRGHSTSLSTHAAIATLGLAIRTQFFAGDALSDSAIKSF